MGGRSLVNTPGHPRELAKGCGTAAGVLGRLSFGHIHAHVAARKHIPPVGKPTSTAGLMTCVKIPAGPE